MSASQSTSPTIVELWFSYADEQQAFVEQLANTLIDDTQQGATLCAKAKQQIKDKDLKYLGDIQLIPKIYQQQNPSNTEGRIYRLSPTEDINLLVDDIASAFSKVLVLSKAYFASYVCLREMALTLSSLHIDKHFYPWLLIDQEIEAGLFTGESEYKFEVRKGEISETTLLDALQQVHETLATNPIVSLRTFDLSAQRRDEFETLLPSLEYKLYSSAAMDSQALAILAHRYVLTQLSRLPRDKLDATLEGLFKAWRGVERKPYLSLLVPEYPIDAYPLNVCNTIEGACLFLRELYGALNSAPVFLQTPKQKEEIMLLCGLVLLRVESALDTALMSHFYEVDQLTSLSLPFNVSPNFEQAIHVTMSFSKATGTPIKVNADASLGCTSVNGPIFPFRTGLDASGDAAIVFAFKQLYSQLLGACDIDVPDTLEAIKAKRGVIDKVRTRLIHFKKDVTARNYWALSGGFFGFIVLDVSITVENQTAFMHKLERLLNYDNPETTPFVRIPKVLLKTAQAQAHQSTFSFRLLNEIENALLPAIQNIHTLLYAHQ